MILSLMTWERVVPIAARYMCCLALILGSVASFWVVDSAVDLLKAHSSITSSELRAPISSLRNNAPLEQAQSNLTVLQPNLHAVAPMPHRTPESLAW